MRNTRWLMLRWNSFVQLLLYFCIPGTVREVMPFPFVLSLQLIPSIPPSKHLRHLLTARNRPESNHSGGDEMGILMFLPTMLASRADLLVENLALRQQLAVLKRSVKRPKLRKRDRVFWVWLSTLEVVINDKPI